MKAPAKKRDQKSTKAKLLKAALDIFSKEGYDAATTRAIAKKAGVNESLIHRYFESKLGLFLALKAQYRQDFITQYLAKHPENESLADELVAFLKYKLESSRQNKKFFKLSISRAILDPKVRDTVQTYAQLKPQPLVDRFIKLQKNGQIRKDLNLDRVIDVVHVLSFAISLLSEAFECLNSEESEEIIATATDIFVRGLTPKK
jgi:AcrR family transcriptional regulator